MGELINGRTAEEIKQGILCSNGCCDCPYAGFITEDETCSEHVTRDTLALIAKLEAALDEVQEKYEKEKDCSELAWWYVWTLLPFITNDNRYKKDDKDDEKMTIYYAIKRNNMYLKDVEPNPDYKKNSAAPTMGRPHVYAEYRTVWSDEITAFERLTVADHIKTLMEEYRWGSAKPIDFTIVCMKKDGEGWVKI